LAEQIVFNVSKGDLGNPTQSYKGLLKALKAKNFKCALNKDEMSAEKLKKAYLLIMAGSNEMFRKSEFDALNNYVESGGNLLILGSEGGESKLKTNLNYLLESFGVCFNTDAVVRTSYCKYLHPKECYIQNGVLEEEIVRVANGQPKAQKTRKGANFVTNYINDRDDDEMDDSHKAGLSFVYPYGCTLSVQSPSVPLLSSGALSYPVNKHLMAAYKDKSGKGKVMVAGSYLIFGDEYLGKDENSKILEFILRFFEPENDIEFAASGEEIDDEEDPTSGRYLPDVASISDRLKSCLQESEDLPTDFRHLFQSGLHKIDMNHVPAALKLYSDLSMKQEPLTLITPNFEVPLLGLIPAVFPPILKDLPPPPLELFDLDDEFAPEKYPFSFIFYHLKLRFKQN
jgi:intraflagellar transport protein 52